MHTDPTYITEWLEVLGHLDSTRYLSGTLKKIIPSLFALAVKVFQPSFLCTHLVFEYPRDSLCDVIINLFSIADSY